MREIANDWSTARLSIQSEGQDPSRVADEVNKRMASAVGIAKKAKGVEVRSGSYTTHPVYDDGRIVRWRANQELRLESADTDRLAKLIGQLQSDSVLLSNISFSVQRSTRKSIEDELIEEALAAFRARAALVAKGMNASDWSLINLSVNQSGGQPQRVHMRAEADMMMKSSRAAAPVFEAGTSEINVQVGGQIEID